MTKSETMAAGTRDMTGGLDPVDYAVITQGLIAAAREMGAKLIRSAYSTIVREASDASAALLDRNGNVIAQAELIPMQLGPMRATFQACADVVPVDDLQPGDFYINNDPFAGGQHLQDVFIYTPVFVDGHVVAFAGTVAHHLDLGGGNPGLNPDAADVHAEGLLFPPSRYNFERDWDGGPLERFVARNIRVPEQTIGDFNAQFAANAIGAHRVGEMCRKYGTDKVLASMDALMDYTERRFRAALRDVPDGVYYGEDAVDDDGLTDDHLVVKASVEVRGDTIAIDFEGTCEQVRRNLNCPLSSTISAALSAVKAVLTSADIPFNEGLKRPVTIKVPEGSILNPTYPAPVRARMEAAYRAFNAVMKALAQIVPDRVIAGGHDTTTVLAISHLSTAGYRVYLEVFGGGYGASPRTDGCDAVDSPLSNCSNTPVEATDMEFDHFRIVGYGLVPDSGGPGRRRGGLSFFRSYEILKDNVNFAIYADRFRIAPYGLEGGQEGTCGRCEILRDGKVLQVRSKDNVDLRRGDVVTLITSGGAGYGDPAEREAELIERDLREGYVTDLKQWQALGAQAAE
ncbi:hydantoinase B/oxoprolinase family protein [Futiania mangrovi]|uniref:Hydantoinase B/oxoprolinase family protein n=1 Tax=Futiania mangrovi TaxID=2959716 RepID=A0A9J6PAI1_9PROT|nr:hydantoinase B/oxoprolinase family protein [Futiania mangrovii]MCP1337084.1 hydantoinase B/oxoprolinase family protein [Futiania mangrovii]